MAANYKSMIKSAFSNKIHKLLNPENKKTGETIYRLGHLLTDKEKLELYNSLIVEYQKSTTELRNAMNKRRDKNKVARIREAKWQEKAKGIVIFSAPGYLHPEEESEQKQKKA